MDSNRLTAMVWWGKLSNEQKWEQIVKNKQHIVGYPDRLPETLTGREIEILYNNSQ